MTARTLPAGAARGRRIVVPPGGFRAPAAILRGSRGRFERPASTWGPGLRRGIAFSLAVHGLLVGAVVAEILGPEPAPPRPRSLETAIEAAVTLEAEPPPAPEEPPVVPPEPFATETLLDVVEAEPDPRLEEEAAEPPPPGDLPGTVGIPSPDGARRPASVGVRGGGGVRGDGGTGEASGTPAAAAPPAPKAAPFVPASRRDGLCPAPEYPRRERDRGTQGTVRLRLVVAEDGSVAEATVADSSGSPALDAAALRAVRSWRFAPATLDGASVASVVLQPLDFRLTE